MLAIKRNYLFMVRCSKTEHVNSSSALLSVNFEDEEY